MNNLYLSKIISLAVACGIASSPITIFAETQEKNKNLIETKINLTNTGDNFKLSDLKIRYYLKDATINENTETISNNIELISPDYPYYLILTPDTQIKVHKISKPIENANAYIEASFTNDVLITNSSKLNIDFSLSIDNWNNFKQQDDYSYNKGPVAYINGKVIFGRNPIGINSADKSKLYKLYNTYIETKQGIYTFSSYLNFKQKSENAK